MKARVLLVDDEPDFRGTLAFWLRSKDYETREAGGGDDALAIIRKEPIDVVFLDIHLPPTDGVIVLGQIRALKPALPIIMVTAHPESETMAKARALGISGFFPKAGDFKDLAAVIDVALRHHKGL